MNLSYNAVIVSASCLFVTNCQRVATGDDKPKVKPERSANVDALVERVFSAYGGLEKLKKHTTWRQVRIQTTETTRPGSKRKTTSTITETTTVQLPDKYRRGTVTKPGRFTHPRRVFAWNKGRTWSWSPLTGQIKGDPNRADPRGLRGVARSGPLRILAFADQKRKRSVEPAAKVGGIDAFVIKLYSVTGKSHQFWYFDNKTALLLMQVTSNSRIRYSDYSKVDGISYARKINSRSMQFGRITEIKEELTRTVPKTVDPKLFEKP